MAGEKDREVFHDVVSINEQLGESDATVGLFKQVEVAQPDFAASVYDLADDALVGAGEYGLARKYLGDPLARLESAKRDFDEGMEYAKTGRSGDACRQAFKRIFTDEIVRIVTVLDKTGSPDRVLRWPAGPDRRRLGPLCSRP